jgi:Right handed beta helix region
MIRIIARLFAVTFALAALLHGTPLHAAPFTWVSSTGTSGGPCAIAQPCPILFDALASTDAGGQVSCLNSPGIDEGSMFLNNSATIDCLGVHTGFGGDPQITLAGTGQVFKIRNLTFTGTGGGTPTAIKVTGSGILILENCVFDNFSGTALDIEPTGPLNLVIKNSRISNSAAGVLIKPAVGGSVTATFDGVTIADNTGGGLKTDTTNGLVQVDISNSTITKNAGNGLNAVSGAGGTNILNLSHDVIASNGTAGIQANGGNAAALIDTTLLDSNTAGATSAVGGGRLLSYGNNRIVGAAGSGFTGTAPLN